MKDYYDLKPNILDNDIESCIRDRHLYYYLLSIEEHTAFLPFIWNKAIESLSSISSKSNDSIQDILLDIEKLITFRNQISNHYKTIDNTAYSIDTQRYIMQHYAPFYRIDACWLSGSISLKDACRNYGSILLKSHAEIAGNGHVEKSHAFLFEQHAAAYHINFLPVYSDAYAADIQIEDYAFSLPTFLLALSQFPTLLLPEILGANLLMSLMNFPFLLPTCEVKSSSFLKMKASTTEKLIHNAVQAIQAYINLDTNRSMITRIERGFMATLSMYERFHIHLKQTILNANKFSAQSKMLSIVEKIGTQARGYHKRGEIGGKPIDEWFDPDNFSGENILTALANSRYIKPGYPEKSPFLTHITSPSGPMFRIFSDEELKIINKWILSLDKDHVSPDHHGENHNKIKMDDKAFSPTTINQSEIIQASKQKYGRCTLQELYYYLLNIDQYPDLYPIAKIFTSRWLKRHSTKLSSGDCALPFKTYHHEKLDAWLTQQHEKQVSSYLPLKGCPDEKKADVIREATRIAPLTYIDGAWVRKMLSPSMVTTNVSSRLYHIYIDELGNGDLNLHHGNIYRRLMKDMGIELPDFDTREFSQSPHFDEDDFQVPVYWLAISLFPKTFLPEILGLNLAMELSGIGGEYRRSGDILKHYGFSAQFTAIHNTIDNIVSGHTAWSIEAIKLHLDDVFQKSGRRIVQEHWYRIWTGYRSLTPPKGIYSYGIAKLARLFHKQESHEIAHAL